MFESSLDDQGLPSGSEAKNPLANTGDAGSIPGQEDPLEKGPTAEFLPGESHGQRSLAGYHPWGHRESNMTWSLNTHTHTHTH